MSINIITYGGETAESGSLCLAVGCRYGLGIVMHDSVYSCLSTSRTTVQSGGVFVSIQWQCWMDITEVMMVEASKIEVVGHHQWFWVFIVVGWNAKKFHIIINARNQFSDSSYLWFSNTRLIVMNPAMIKAILETRKALIAKIFTPAIAKSHHPTWLITKKAGTKILICFFSCPLPVELLRGILNLFH